MPGSKVSCNFALRLLPAPTLARLVMQDAPLITEAFSHGRICYSKVRAIARIVTPENEQTLLDYALDGTASQLERVIRSYRRAGAAEQELTTRQHDGRYLSYHHDDDNMMVLRGRLPPEVGALLIKALQVTAEQDTEQPDSEPSQRLVDALGEVAGAALGQGLAHRAGKKRTPDYQVLVHVECSWPRSATPPDETRVSSRCVFAPQRRGRSPCRRSNGSEDVAFQRL